MASRVLIVDDDPDHRILLEKLVRDAGHVAECAGGGEAALARLARGDAPPVAAMILDLVMPDLDGMAVLERLTRQSLSLPVIVQTTAGGAGAAVSALRAGALDFLVKPASAERVQVSLSNALKVGALENEISRSRRSRGGTLGFRDIILASPAMDRVVAVGERAARSLLPVLVEGEPGVGKELIARAIHGSGARRARPFVSLNCAAAPPAEIEAALFGDAARRGTSAMGGRLAEAEGGTLFLEAVGLLAPSAQERLLRLLEESEAKAAETRRPRRSGIRLIAATDRRLVDLVAQGAFREDLFYRLNVLPVWLPPLRDRRSDIPALARDFLARHAADKGCAAGMAIAPEAMDLLCAFDWPGNVRQLENAIFRAVAFAAGAELTAEDFPLLLASMQVPAAAATAGPLSAPQPVADRRHEAAEQPAAPAGLPDRRGIARYGLARLLDERGEMRRFEAIEEEMIRFAVDHYRGHMSEVARRLGIGRSTLYRKLKDYGIVPVEALAR